MDARMKAVLSSCILRCLPGRRSTRPKQNDINDIKEQQRLPKPAPMTERRRRGPLFLIFIIFRIMQVIRNIGKWKSPLFRVSGLSSGSWAFWAGWSRFFAFCTVVLFECIVLYVWSAFLFYTRPAVVCKNFSDNSHHFLIPAAHIFQERSVCAPSRSLCMYWYLIPVSINQFLHQKCSYCLFPSIYPSWSFWFFS